jgi:hypothetical protein
MAILNPITDAAVAALSWALEPERKLQSLLQLWLETYFSGTPFQTRGPNGTTETKTFARAAVRMQENAMAGNPQEPVIEVTFDAIHTEREIRSAETRGQADGWLASVLCKVPAATAGMGGTANDPEHAVRRLASHVQWLFNSSELAALGAHGIHHVTVARPPVICSAGAWLGRMMTVEMRTHREQVR